MATIPLCHARARCQYKLERVGIWGLTVVPMRDGSDPWGVKRLFTGVFLPCNLFKDPPDFPHVEPLCSGQDPQTVTSTPCNSRLHIVHCCCHRTPPQRQCYYVHIFCCCICFTAKEPLQGSVFVASGILLANCLCLTLGAIHCDVTVRKLI